MQVLLGRLILIVYLMHFYRVLLPCPCSSLTSEAEAVTLCFIWCCWGGLNLRPTDYESVALPTELQQQNILILKDYRGLEYSEQIIAAKP